MIIARVTWMFDNLVHHKGTDTNVCYKRLMDFLYATIKLLIEAAQYDSSLYGCYTPGLDPFG